MDAPAPFRLERPAPIALDEAGKVALCRRANDAARAHDGRIHEVTVTLVDASKRFVVANSEGRWAEDRQYRTRLAVVALALAGDQRQQGFASGGGCVEAGYFERERTPEAIARESAGIAVTLLGAREPEAGAYPVIVGPGWGGVLVHECFGHGMEGVLSFGGFGITSIWITLAQRCRWTVPRQSAPVSPPPRITTRLPSAAIRTSSSSSST